jgi:two-component system, OmpR family, sensor histidine kinase VicK
MTAMIPEPSPASSRTERALDPRGWALIAVGLATIFLILLAAGVLAVVQNARVKNAAVYALTHDVEIEDEAEDIRLQALELRVQHRNLLFGRITQVSLEDLDAAWIELDREIDSLNAIDVSGLDIPPPAAIREAADRYWADFRPAVAVDADPSTVRDATLRALERLDIIEDMAAEIDLVGTRLTADGLANVQRAASTERTLIGVLLAGTAIAAVLLAFSAARLFRQLRDAYAGERTAREELARALQTKKDFVADASHELRTPLAVIRGSAELALAAGDSAEQRSNLARITSEADRMTKLVEDLLFLARSDAGAPPIEREYVPVRWLASHIVERATALVGQRGISLDSVIEGHGFLEADSGRLEQALLALVDNAAKHSPPGEPVRLRAAADGDTLTFTVEDHGPGIPAAELPLVFDRFYQVGSRRSRKQGGYGLGLATARSITEAHGGRLTAASTPGAGTTMMLTVPLATLPDPDGLLAESDEVIPGDRVKSR